MRKLISILFLLVAANCFAQTQVYETQMIGPFPAYKGQYANWKWPVVFTVPKVVKDYINGVPGVKKPKCACSLDAHGIGERSQNYPNMSTYGTGDAYRVLNYGQPMNWRDDNDPYYNKNFAAPGRTDSFCWINVAYQVWQGDSRTRNTYWYNTLTWMLNTAYFKDFIDTNRVYITGLSLGAGGVASALQDENILGMIAGSWSVATGYIDILGGSPNYNWQALRNAKWRGIIVVEHAKDDDVVTYMMSRNMIDSIQKYNLPITIIYRERNLGGHALIVNDAWDPVRAPVNIPLSNGNSYNHIVPWQSILLMRTKSGRRKDNSIPPLLVILFIPLTRKKRADVVSINRKINQAA